MNEKKIAVFTGKRGGFGAMLKIMESINAEPGMTLSVIASDMHLSSQFGNTLDEVKQSITVDAVVDMGDYGSKPIDRTQALGRCIQELAKVLDELRPDILLLLGDRGETLAAAVCAAEMGVTIAHIQAGDISGGIDELHRHSITKLAHLHFSQNETQRQRVINLGEDPERVWNTGAPYIDNVLSRPVMGKKNALKAIGLDQNIDYFIMLQHSDSYRPEVGYDHTIAILSALKEQDAHAIIVYPCSDPGYDDVIRALDTCIDHPQFHFFKSIEALVFLGLLNGSKALVGNSSGGIIEAPYLNVPFVNVGLRQEGRETAANVIWCDGSKESISKAIEKSQTPEIIEVMKKDENHFGDGRACGRIFQVLRDTKVTPELYRKRITY